MTALGKPLGRGLHADKPMFTLRLLREAAGLTQGAVVAESGMYQADISKLENRESLDEVQVSTLRRYAKALGAEVQLVVVFNGRRYVLRG